MCVLARILLLVCFIAHLLVGQATDYDNEGRLVADYDNDKRLAADYDIDKRVAADYDNEEQLAVEYDNEEGIAVDYDKEDSLAILHRLHRAHCGDAALCNNDTITNGSHLEPWMTMFPRPCCAPCSCLPNCEEYQNCCPFIRNLRKGNYTDSVSSSTNRRRDKVRI